MELIVEFIVRGLLFEYTGSFARKLWYKVLGKPITTGKKNVNERKMESFLDKLLGFIILTAIVVLSQIVF